MKVIKQAWNGLMDWSSSLLKHRQRINGCATNLVICMYVYHSMRAATQIRLYSSLVFT